MAEGDQAYLECCKDEHMPVPPFDRYIYMLPNYVVKKPLLIGEIGYQGYKPDVETVLQRDENEVEAMKLAQEYTNVPIPRVIHRGEGFNVFERIQGITINEKSIWDSVNPRQREAIRLQVQGFIQQLAAIPNLTGEVRSLVPSGQIFHLQLPNRGPFKSTEDFTKAYADHGVLGAIFPESGPVFSHMDLDFSNLILHPNLDAVAGVIDWERACFFPEGGRSIHHMCHQWPGWETLFDGLEL